MNPSLRPSIVPDFDPQPTLDDDRSATPDEPSARTAFAVRVVSGPEVRFAEIQPGRPVVVGRSPDCRLQVDTTTISRRHLVLAVSEGGRVTLEDLRSRNGTWIGGVRVEGTVVLEDGARVEIGDVVLRVDLVGGAELEHLRSTAERLAAADRDPLTGLGTRRRLDEDLARAAALHEAGQETASVLFLDLDWFKSINDRYGHATGDRVLGAAACVARGALRGCDTPVRYGGEELVVVLRGCGLAAAESAAERIRSAMTRFPWRSLGVVDGKVTLSCGVAERRHGEAAEAWLERADQAMYRAKQQGRDWVVLAP